MLRLSGPRGWRLNCVYDEMTYFVDGVARAYVPLAILTMRNPLLGEPEIIREARRAYDQSRWR